MRILILQTAFIGDVALSIPLLKNLREQHPQARVTYYCRKGLRDFLLKTGFVSDVVEVDKSSRESLLKGNAAILNVEWDWVICVHESWRTKILLARLKARRKTAYSGLFVFADEKVARPMQRPEAMRTLALIEPRSQVLKEAFAEFDTGGDEECAEVLQVSANERDALRLGQQTPGLTRHRFRPIPAALSMRLPRLEKIHQTRALDLLSPRARAVLDGWAPNGGAPQIVAVAPGSIWATKRWPREYFGQVIRELSQNHTVVLLGAPDERELCLQLCDGAIGVICAAGETSLWESAEIFAIADFALTNDSGSMHLASLSGVPTLSLFGPTVLAQGYRPWNEQAQVLDVDLKCRPCGKHGARECPLGTHACMQLIRPQEAFKAIGEVSRND